MFFCHVQAFESVALACSTYDLKDSEDIIPYSDALQKEEQQCLRNTNVVQLQEQKKAILMQIAQVDAELYNYRNILTSALWELNDLGHAVSN